MCRATAQASDRPSKVLVPRPISSIRMRLRVGGVVQDVRGFGHLHHERGAPAGQIVARADAREDAIERPEHRALRRHEAADVREQHDQRAPGACRWTCRPCSGR